MAVNETKEELLSNYKPLDYQVVHADLEIDLTKQPVTVKSRLTIKPNSVVETKDLFLDGQNIHINSISLNNKPLSNAEFVQTEAGLLVKNVPQEEFTIETDTTINTDNKDLFGLYQTEGVWLVKAETQGLRRVIFCNDRPDNLTTYTTKIISDEKFPTLLANGKLIAKEDLGGGKHAAVWDDKTPKASYLFAVVAGNFECKEAPFVNKLNQTIPIQFYLSKDALPQCDYAMGVIQKAMAWDENTYGVLCDLPQHMVTGVNKYASGASEPLGLNLFNTQFLLATPETKTDEAFLRVAEVVSHEFFHYWSGDRVTIRDWFNLALKEGLTTFREQEFLEYLFGEDLMRIYQGKTLEEGAPRLSSYVNVRSLYTEAAYEKTAEIFRMLKNRLGADVFYPAMNLYFKNNDGKAVTLETLIETLEQYSGIDLSQFMNWFTQAGVPHVDVSDEYDPATKVYTLKIKQSNTNKDDPYQPLPIPIRLGLLDKNGNELKSDITEYANELEQTFRYENIASKPIPSLFRQFSAPVNYEYPYTDDELLLLMQHDTNLFNRKEAANTYVKHWVKAFCDGKNPQLSPKFFDAYRDLLQDKNVNAWIKAMILELPSETDLIAISKPPKMDKIHEAREFILFQIAHELSLELRQVLSEGQVNSENAKGFNIQEASIRRLQKTCLELMARVNPEDVKATALQTLKSNVATNMTQATNALTLLGALNVPEFKEALEIFYQQWSHDNSAVNYWFRIQASTPTQHATQMVRDCLNHAAFDITVPNKVYAVILPYCSNPNAFHALSGEGDKMECEGYKILSDLVIELDKINPAVAARILPPLLKWQDYEKPRNALMRGELERIQENAISSNVLGPIKKSLAIPLEEKQEVKVTQKCGDKLLQWLNPGNNSSPKPEIKPENQASQLKC